MERDVRINLTYFDQNESFARALPQPGRVRTVVRNVAARSSGIAWAVLELDQPLEYQNRHHRQVLIRSRWQGHAVGDDEPTSVFILLPRNSEAVPQSEFDLANFDHVAWGMAKTLRD